MIPVRVIEAKRDGARLVPDDLRALLQDYVDGSLPDYQMSALLMAIVFRGLDAAETGVFVDTMLTSGRILDLSELGAPCVDKHSTGGVGDKVSIALAPLAAEMGVFVPMMSGRGLGHTTGTLDKLEAIPGFRVDLDLRRFQEVLERVGCAMIGQTEEIAPLDRKLYALRDVTGTVPSVPLIAASIMSKKLAEGLDGLVLDVKVGAGAFLPDLERARTLARTMVRLGSERGLRTVALLTAMDRPLGHAIGNGLETAEAVRCLRGEGPTDLRELVLELVTEMGLIGGAGSDRKAVAAKADRAIGSGRALERLRRMIEEQGGDPRVVDAPDRLHTAPGCREVRAGRGGVVMAVHPRPLGEGVIALGGGRTRLGQEIDLGVGFEISVKPGDVVQRHELIARVHASDEDDLDLGERVVRASVEIGEEGSGVDAYPLVLERIEDE